MSESIREEFSREDITEYQIDMMNDVRERCSEMLEFIEDRLGDTRYSEICKIKLEEVCMFANKGIAKLCKPRPNDKI